MLKPITFTVEAESGPLEVTASGLDYAAYEDTFDRAAVTDLSAGRYKFFTFIVWHAMHRQDLTKDSFQEFLATSPDVGPGRVEDVVPLESPVPIGA